MPDEILERIESIAPHMQSAGAWIRGAHREIAEEINDFYAAV
jgi:hypothetical protein